MGESIDHMVSFDTKVGKTDDDKLNLNHKHADMLRSYNTCSLRESYMSAQDSDDSNSNYNQDQKESIEHV